MVYRQQGMTIPQEFFVNRQFNGPFNLPASDAVIRGFLNMFWINGNGGCRWASCRYAIGKLSCGEIRQHFAQRNAAPIIVTTQNGPIGHAVVLYGYEDRSDGTFYLHIFDPQQGYITWNWGGIRDWNSSFLPSITGN
jgi:hypothetical protein